MEWATLRPRRKPSSLCSLPASSRQRACSGCLERNSLDLVRNLKKESRSTRRSKGGMRVDSDCTSSVLGLSSFLFLDLCSGGFIKEVENEKVAKVRVREDLNWVGLDRTKVQTMDLGVRVLQLRRRRTGKGVNRFQR